MSCPTCHAEMRKFGKNRNGSQRYRCNECRKTFTDESTRQDGRRLDPAKLIMALRMLLEGNSIRAVERLIGVGRNTIMIAMVEAGENCKRFLEKTARGISVNDIQADETWGFVGCKEKTRLLRNYPDHGFGDAYCYAAIARPSRGRQRKRPD
jgi:transposase-like protein